MKVLITVMALIFSMPLIAQKKLSIDAEFNYLLHYKRSFEQYRDLSVKRPEFAAKRDSFKTAYDDMIKKIKDAPEIYLTHIDRAIEKNKVEYDGPIKVFYDYFPTHLPFDPELHSLTRLELYKIIKKHLFEKNANALPEKTEAYEKAGGDKGYYTKDFD